MKNNEQYSAKLRSPEQLIAMINSKDVVLTTGNPRTLLEALFEAKERLDGLKLYSVLGVMRGQGGGGDIDLAETASHIHITSVILSQHEERAWSNGGINQTPVHLSVAEEYIQKTCQPTVLLVHCPPPDEEGYFYMSIDDGGASAAMDRGVRVFIQVNKNIPLIYSDTRIHISRVNAISEATEPIFIENVKKNQITKEDTAIADYVAERIPDGSTIQFGPGFLPNLTGKHLENHKDLGIHTDCLSWAHIELIKNGVVNNSRKEIMPGVSVGSYFDVLEDDFSFLHKNSSIMIKKLSWVCNPAIISQIGNMMSINEGLAVDFRAQVCSSSLGLNFTGSTSSIHDFVRGTKRSQGGKAFIVMRSTMKGENGERKSCILPALPEGSLVSVPRSDIHYVVTEYGVADLRNKSVRERVQALIGLAHPDFREWLTSEAVGHGFA